MLTIRADDVLDRAFEDLVLEGVEEVEDEVARRELERLGAAKRVVELHADDAPKRKLRRQEEDPPLARPEVHERGRRRVRLDLLQQGPHRAHRRGLVVEVLGIRLRRTVVPVQQDAAARIDVADVVESALGDPGPPVADATGHELGSPEGPVEPEALHGLAQVVHRPPEGLAAPQLAAEPAQQLSPAVETGALTAHGDLPGRSHLLRTRKRQTNTDVARLHTQFAMARL